MFMTDVILENTEKLVFSFCHGAIFIGDLESSTIYLIKGSLFY